jgi:NADPH-dependent curcumin reductase CurA
MAVNRKVVLRSHPKGPVSLDNFDIVEEDLAPVRAGQVCVRVDHLSIDAFIRTTLDGGGFHQAAKLGGVVPALGVGTVVESADPAFAVGDVVTGPMCSQSFAVLPVAMCAKVDTGLAAPTAFLGALSIATGLTSYVGMKYVARISGGETVVVSGAAGAVGSLAGQVARLLGASRVIGIAGGPDKCRFLVEELGFDEAVDYKAGNVAARLAEIAPNGVDVFYDNVGGDVLDAVLLNLAIEARVVLCGAVSQYENMADVRGPKNYLKIAERDARLLGFTIFHYPQHHAEATVAMAEWLAAGKIVVREHVEQGIDRFPAAVRALLDGGNTGKFLLKVS